MRREHLIGSEARESSRLHAAAAAETLGIREFLRRCSPVDAIAFGYLSCLVTSAAQGSGPHRTFCLATTSAMLGVFLLALVNVRAGSGARAAYVYRVVMLGELLGSYLLMRQLLPTARGDSYDLALLHIDRALFGVEPTVWLERWVTPARTEWFAAFYLSYFLILALHVLPMLFFCRDERRLSEIGFLVVALFCLGNLGYFVVPGFGPHAVVHYTTELPRGGVQRLMLHTVDNGGALKDIFPSLHTAFPIAFTLFAYRNRDSAPWKYTWPIVAFLAANIVAATLYLRWHYAIDVVAGIVLAVFISRLAPYVAAREAARRRAARLGPDWPPLP